MAKYKMGNGIPTWNGISMVNSDNYAGYFGTDTFFVDGDNGLDGNKGTDASKPLKTIQKAIDLASAHDTIYINTKAPESDASEPGTYVEDLTIAYAKHGLRLIGVNGAGALQPFGGPKIKNATATALLTVNASNVLLKGLQFNCTRNSGTYGVRLQGVAGYATLAGSVGTQIVDCYFKNASATYGGISVYGGYACLVSRCTFHLGTNALGINLDCNTVPNNGHTIEWCNFKSNNGAAVALHMSLENSKDVNVDHCNFDQATKFITVVDGCTGMISNCTFNDGSTAVVANSTGKVEIPAACDEVGVAGCWGGDGTAVDADGA
jgi:hypothetical protein